MGRSGGIPRRRLLGAATALGAGLLPLGPADRAFARQAPLDGMFVQTPDGAVSVIVAGLRYPIAPVAVSADQLAGIPVADAVQSLGQLTGPSAAGPGEAPAPAAPAAPATAPPPAAPAAQGFEALIGQSLTTVSTQNTSVTLRYDVRDVYTGWYDANSSRRFAIPIFNITNLGPAATRVGVPTNIAVQDEGGTNYLAADQTEQEYWRAYLTRRGERVGDIYTPIAAGGVMPLGVAFKNIPVGRTLKLVKI